MLISRRIALVSLVAALVAARPAPAGAFKLGDLVVDAVGSNQPGGTSAATNLIEFSTSGSVVQTIALPTTDIGGNHALTNSSSAGSEGALALSPDGRFLTLAGYDAPTGVSGIAGTATTGAGGYARVIGVVDGSGNVNTSTLIADGYSGNNIRGAVTSDGTHLYASGAGNGPGTREANLGSTGSSSAITATPSLTSTRVSEIVNGQLYQSSGSTNLGIYAVGSGLPAGGSGVTATQVAADGNAYGFVFLGGNLYVADGTLGILKFTANGTSNGLTTYGNATTIFAGAGFTGLAGTTGPNGVEDLYAVNPTSLVSIVDQNNGQYTSSTLAAASGVSFRGIAFAPTAAPTAVPEPASVALTGLGLLVAAGVARLRLRSSRAR